MDLLLINPTSGGGHGAQIGKRVRSWLSANDRQYRDISASSYESAASALSNSLGLGEKFERLIVVGGDGVVHLAIQALAGTALPLLLIPAGTGNDLARTMKLPLDEPEELLERYADRPARAIDLGRVNGQYFADILSTGFDSVVNERANRMRRIRGRGKYNAAILLELPLFKPIEYEFTLDNRVFTSSAMLIAIANGCSYGGGMRVCPDASLIDGRFDVMILEPVSKVEFLRVFPKVFSGSHITHPKVRIERATTVELRARAIAYADGERIGPLPIRAEVVPHSLLTWGEF